MPFYKRTVEPRSLVRINRDRLDVQEDVFSSLDAVNCQALMNVLRQLCDVSRHASCMFVELQTEAALVINKASALQHRLDTLQDTVRHLNHRRTTTREFFTFMCSRIYYSKYIITRWLIHLYNIVIVW